VNFKRTPGAQVFGLMANEPLVRKPMSAIQDTLLDSQPMFQERGLVWCCLLCERQFRSTRHLSRHINRSDLHAGNLSAARSAKRVTYAQGGDIGPIRRCEIGNDVSAAHQQTTARAGSGESSCSSGREMSANRSVCSDVCGTGNIDQNSAESHVRRGGERASASAPPSTGLSALEQMELFQRRLQKQDKLKPAVTEDPMAASIREAREINQQTDWECSGCKQFNFARSLVCYACNRPVDEDTKYLPFGSRVRNLERMAASRLAAPEDHR